MVHDKSFVMHLLGVQSVIAVRSSSVIIGGDIFLCRHTQHFIIEFICKTFCVDETALFTVTILLVHGKNWLRCDLAHSKCPY
jgi:hypothetical protein